MAITYPEPTIITPTMIEDLIDPCFDEPSDMVLWLAQLDMAMAAVDNGTLGMARAAGLIDIHYGPWEVE